MTPEELLRDKYQLIHRLGGGGGGPVYKALQVSTGQTVVVKLLSLDEGRLGEARGDEGRVDVNDRRLERFRREVAFCSQLYHPDIVRLLDSGDLPQRLHFAVFEFIPGLTLAQLLGEQGALPVQRARKLMMQLLPPLAYAHGKGIFHRDLKPSNLMITEDAGRDRLKILDFGISIATQRDYPERDRLTLSHEWVGTPTYAAPEQLRGEPVEAGCDLYAWGLIFIECLTGSSVVTGKSLPEIIRQQLLAEPHAIPAALQTHRLGTLLSRVLDKVAARRPSDAAALLAMLETISTDGLEDAQGYLKESSGEGAHRRAPADAFDTLINEPRRQQIELRRATIVCCKVTIVSQPSKGQGNWSSVEQLDTLIEDTSGVVREIMGRFGATLSHSFGQYSLAYFGLFRARDSDARLALEAALETVNRIERAPPWLTELGLALHVQIGIHNGPVTVQLHEGSRRQVDGLTASVAMRLACVDDSVPAPVPPPIGVLVSHDFRALVARHARFEPVETAIGATSALETDAGPAYRFAGSSLPQSPRVPVGGAGFVGRRAELEQLLGAWRSRGDVGRGAVLISGEPGIGKSRLAVELDQTLQEEGVEWLEIRCLPEWQNGFLRPLATLCLQKLAVAGGSPVQAAAQLGHRIAELGLDPVPALPLLCTWLSLPIPGGHVPLPWSPQKQRQMLHQTLADLLIARMERGAALLVEDLHWADPSTLDCLDVLLQRARGHSTFMIMTSRPGLRLSWSVSPQVLTLGGLDSAAARVLAAALVPPSLLPEVDVARMAERSDGVPLYLEELAKAFRGYRNPDEVSRDGHRAGFLSPEAVPPSLHDLLTSRLDDIGEAKYLAQFAATVGRQFSLDRLAVLLDKDALSLLGDLEQLVNAEILISRPGIDGSNYVFRHALIRDAAYDSMAPLARRRTHERVAEGLESSLPALVEAEPDVIAYHWERAGNATRAIGYWQRAARKSSIASAHLEALAQLQRGLSLVEKLPPSHDRSVREAELLLARGATIVTKRGYTDPLAASSFERAAALVPATGDTVELAFAARWGLWYFHNTQANLRSARALTDELTRIAEVASDAAMTVSALEAVCETSFCIGRLDDCVRASRRCEDEYSFERHRHLCTVRGDDPHLASLSFEAFAEMVRGRHDTALARVEQGLTLADKLAYPAMKAGMHSQAAWVRLIWGGSGAEVPDMDGARQHARIAIDTATELGFRFWAVYGGILDAAASIVSGDLAAVDRLREGAETWKGAGAGLGRCWQLTFVGQALRRRGDYDGALATLDAALAFCEEHDSRFFEPEVWRQRAEIFLEPKNPKRDIASGLAQCARAAESAANRGAGWWVLAASVTGARYGDPARVVDLRRVVAEFPLRAIEPPLLREARKMLQAERPAGAMTA